MVEPITITLRNTARSYLEIIFHRKWLLIVPIIFATLLPGATVIRLLPMYKSQAVIEVQERAKENPYIKGFSKSTPIQQRMGNILQRVRSRSVIEDIIQELNLAENTRNEYEKRTLINNLRENIEVTISRNHLLKVSCSYVDPKACQKVVNLLTRMIIKENLALQDKETQAGIEWLDQELEFYKNKMDEASQKLQKFQEKYAEVMPEEVSQQLYSTVTFKPPDSPQAITPPFGPSVFAGYWSFGT